VFAAENSWLWAKKPGKFDEKRRNAAISLELLGPFSRYGSKLVAACVKNGTHYCDITGELGWVREMIATHDQEARRTGANIVHLCVSGEIGIFLGGSGGETPLFVADVDVTASPGTCAPWHWPTKSARRTEKS